MIRTRGRERREAAALLASAGAARWCGAGSGAAACERIVRDVRAQRRSSAAALCGAIRRACRGSNLRVSQRRDGCTRGKRSIRRCAGAEDGGGADSGVCKAGNCRKVGASLRMPDSRLGQRVLPLGSVGCYVPSGRYPLPSTLLMTVIPAQVAGVERIVVVSPKPAPETLAAAHLLGITEFYRIGGAHAIAALAYGTASNCACGQDCRAGKSVCDCGQAPGGVRLRDRHARGTDRNCGDQRARRSRQRLPPTWLRKPSMIPKRWQFSSQPARPREAGDRRKQERSSRKNPIAREALDKMAS